MKQLGQIVKNHRNPISRFYKFAKKFAIFVSRIGGKDKNVAES